MLLRRIPCFARKTGVGRNFEWGTLPSSVTCGRCSQEPLGSLGESRNGAVDHRHASLRQPHNLYTSPFSDPTTRGLQEPKHSSKKWTRCWKKADCLPIRLEHCYLLLQLCQDLVIVISWEKSNFRPISKDFVSQDATDHSPRRGIPCGLSH